MCQKYKRETPQIKVREKQGSHERREKKKGSRKVKLCKQRGAGGKGKTKAEKMEDVETWGRVGLIYGVLISCKKLQKLHGAKKKG